MITEDQYKRLMDALERRDWIALGLLVAMIVGFLLLRPYLSKWAENAATKQDIGAITNEVEGVKVALARVEKRRDAQYELKREACLEALAILDAHLSRRVIYRAKPGGPHETVKEDVSTVRARRCHGKLIVACDNVELVNTFLDIMTSNTKDATELVRGVCEFRRLVRSELSFDGELKEDDARNYLARVTGDEVS